MKDSEMLLLAGGGLLVLNALNSKNAASQGEGGGSGGGGVSLNLGMPSINLGGWGSDIAQPLKASADRVTADIMKSSAVPTLPSVSGSISNITSTISGAIQKGISSRVSVVDIKGELDKFAKLTGIPQTVDKVGAAATLGVVGVAGLKQPAVFPITGAGMAATAVGNAIMDFFTGGKQVTVPVSKTGKALIPSGDLGTALYNVFKAPDTPLKPVGDLAQGMAGFFGTINNAVGKLFG